MNVEKTGPQNWVSTYDIASRLERTHHLCVFSMHCHWVICSPRKVLAQISPKSNGSLEDLAQKLSFIAEPTLNHARTLR